MQGDLILAALAFVVAMGTTIFTLRRARKLHRERMHEWLREYRPVTDPKDGGADAG